MKDFLRTVLFLLGASLHAQTSSVDTSGWATIPDARSVTPATRAIAAGQSWVHSMPVSNFRLHVEIQPKETDAAGDWPVLEVGSLAIAIGRKDSNPALFYSFNGESVEVLTASSPEPDDSVTVIVDRNGADITIRLGSQSVEKTLSRERDDTLILSAGETQELRLKNLALETPSSVGTASSSDGVVSAKKSTAAEGASGRVNGGTGGRVGQPEANPAVEAQPKKAGPTSAAALSLEVFTPPAVRSARAERLRSLIGNR